MKIDRCGWSAIYLVFTVLFSALLVRPGSAAGQPDRGLRGPAFAPPGPVVEMPADWQQAPIKYDAWAGRADLAVTLDQHLYPALLPSIKRYADQHRLDIAVREGTCGVSAGSLAKKEADMAAFCCPPGPTDRLPGLQYHTMGIGALALFVHKDNPLVDIGYAAAQALYQGKILRWSELQGGGRAGADLPIRLIGRLHCKARPGHWRALLDKDDSYSSGMSEVGAIQDVFQQVGLNVMAVGGFETLYMAGQYGGNVKALSIDGVSPADLDQLAAGNYPLYFAFNISTWTSAALANPHVPEFLRYLMKEMETLDEKFHMVPAARLRQAGWRFNGNELVGEPAANGQ